MQKMTVPTKSSCGGRDAYATLLLLRHPIGEGRSVFDLTHTRNRTGMKEQPLRCSGFASVDMRNDTEIANHLGRPDWLRMFALAAHRIRNVRGSKAKQVALDDGSGGSEHCSASRTPLDVQKKKAPFGAFTLPAVVRKRFVCVCHFVHVFAFFHGISAILRSIDNFVCEALHHGALIPPTSVFR